MTKPKIYSTSLSLLTDLYQLTMSYAYWKSEMADHEAVFHLFFRKLPFKGGYVIAAGLDRVIQYLESFSFDETDIEYLKTLTNTAGAPLFSSDFLAYLSELKFECDVDAIPEGTPAFPYEPLLRVKGPIIQCQIIESALLNLINFPSLIATKASRLCIAAKGESVMEFGLRRAQGVDGALTASRSAYIGGCDSTSNVLAGKLFNIPVKGTHSHSWVMAFDEEEDSFRAFAEALPENCTFLVDTYDSIAGVKKAIRVGKWLKENGKQLLGIRLDSGDLAYLSIIARKLLDEAGFSDTQIVASNELDETVISDLKKQGATIGVWGVGTNLVTAKDHPALDGVYKLSAIRKKGGRWKRKIKLSEQMIKVTNPGILQIKRFYDETGYLGDMIYDQLFDSQSSNKIVDPLDPTREKEMPPETKSQELLVPIFKEGKCLYQSPSLHDIRRKTFEELEKLHPGVKRFLNPHQYVVGLEKQLYLDKVEIIKKIRKRVEKDRLL